MFIQRVISKLNWDVSSFLGRLSHVSGVQKQTLKQVWESSTVEVQRHGFHWEKQIVAAITGKKSFSFGYTSKYDLPADQNPEGVNVSVKTTGSNTVFLADAVRFYESLSEETNMVVIQYKQDHGVKKLTKITELKLRGTQNLLFGQVTKEELVQLSDLIKKVPQKRKPTMAERQLIYELRDSLQQRCGRVHLDVKCNSTQSRLQCSLSGFDKFLSENKDIVVSSDTSPQFRDVTINDTILSGKRVMKSK